MASPTSLKRTSADAGLDGNPQPQVPSTTSTPLTTLPSSPVDTPEFCPGPSTRPNPIHHVIPTDSTAPAFLEKSNKRSKLTFAEKEAREIEKQFKEQQRAEEKVKKEIERVKREEERIKREEEKRIRDAAKEERKKAKEQQAKLRKVEKQKRLDEKQKLEEEKNKKARVCFRTSVREVFGNANLSTVPITPERILCPTVYAKREFEWIAYP